MKNTDLLTNTLIAHRGLHNINDGIPENSVPAFRRAINKGYSIELDVHLTKDKKIVVFHDNTLKRVCGINKKIEECTYDELLKYNLFDTKYKIPLFKEVLNLIDKKVFLLIETKVLDFDGELEKELSKILDNYEGNFAIQSFNIYSVNWFKKNKKDYMVGILSCDFNKQDMGNLKKWILKTLITDIFIKSDFIAYDIKSLPNMYVTKVRKHKKVLGWTIRTKEDFEKAKLYCDGFICENIEELN